MDKNFCCHYVENIIVAEKTSTSYRDIFRCWKCRRIFARDYDNGNLYGINENENSSEFEKYWFYGY